MRKKLKVKHYEKTCMACPSQWNIFTEDGKYIYARYRWGHLSLTLNDRETILSMDVGGELDGSMTTAELIGFTKDILDWNNENERSNE